MVKLENLVTHHWLRPVVADYLGKLNGAMPDIEALRALGVPQADAIALCVAARQPRPMPEKIDRLCALSLLHTLSQQIETGRSCATELLHAGFSDAAARELANIINSTRGD